MKIKVYDNDEKTYDRYTVIYLGLPESRGLFTARAMSAYPYHPQGFGQICSAMIGPHLGSEITFEQLPEDCQKLVREDLEDEESK